LITTDLRLWLQTGVSSRLGSVRRPPDHAPMQRFFSWQHTGVECQTRSATNAATSAKKSSTINPIIERKRSRCDGTLEAASLGGEAWPGVCSRLQSTTLILIPHAHLQLIEFLGFARPVSSDDLRGHDGWRSIAHMTRPSLRALPMMMKAPDASSQRRRLRRPPSLRPLSVCKIRDNAMQCAAR
jgi:hypothetical protein